MGCGASAGGAKYEDKHEARPEARRSSAPAARVSPERRASDAARSSRAEKRPEPRSARVEEKRPEQRSSRVDETTSQRSSRVEEKRAEQRSSRVEEKRAEQREVAAEPAKRRLQPAANARPSAKSQEPRPKAEPEPPGSPAAEPGEPAHKPLSHTARPRALKRLQGELKEFSADDHPLVLSVGPYDATRQLDWVAKISGPHGSLYEKGVFTLDLFFSDEYPFKPPRAAFRTPIFHPNVSTQGKICLNWLNDDWSPLLTVGHLLDAITQLMCEPNLADPLNVVAAELFRRNKEKYDSNARDWTRKYACYGDTGGLGGPPVDPVAVYQMDTDGRPIDDEEAIRRLLAPEPKPKPAPKPNRWQHETR